MNFFFILPSDIKNRKTLFEQKQIWYYIIFLKGKKIWRKLLWAKILREIILKVNQNQMKLDYTRNQREQKQLLFKAFFLFQYLWTNTNLTLSKGPIWDLHMNTVMYPRLEFNRMWTIFSNKIFIIDSCEKLLDCWIYFVTN